MSRVRVVHLSLGLDMGGMEKLLVEFARNANRDRFELHFASLTTTGAAGQEIAQLGWPVSALDERDGLHITLPFRLAQFLRRINANILHTHNTKPLLYGAPAARMTGVEAIIHTRHGQRLGATRRQTAMFNLASRCADRIISVSDDSTQLAISQGLDASKLVTIRNGIDLSNFPFTGPTAKGPAVMVGRLSPEKDLATALCAIAIVAQQEPSFRLLIAGDGACMPELKQLREELGLLNRVEFLGQVANVAAVLGNASMFVLSSLTEGVSLALLEAMARGLPAVATRVGGNPEVMSDGQTGLLVPAESPAELAAAILKVHRDPALARQMGTAARKRVEACFDARGMVEQYELLYEQMLQDKRAVPIPA